MRYVFHPAALTEYAEAVQFYTQRRVELAQALLGDRTLEGNLFTDRTPNLSQKFLMAIREKLGYIPTPEAIFYYAYSVFHSPTYRQRYAEFLKIDFPRLPLTRDNDIFTALAKKGEELVALHLMKSKKLNKVITKYPVSGDNAVTEVCEVHKKGKDTAVPCPYGVVECTS